MKLSVLTYGTEGDTRPVAILCRALMDAGHQVHLLAEAGSLDSARELAVPCAGLNGDIKQDLQTLLAQGVGVNATVKGLSRMANAHAQSWMRQSAEAAAGSNGLIVSGLSAFVGLSVAEHLGIPLIGAGMIPISPTKAFPSPFLSGLRLPSSLNRTSHSLVNWLLWLSFKTSVNQARKQVLGMRPRHRLWTEHPMLYGVSPALLPRPADWPANATLCGQWSVPDQPWTPSADLQAFLDAGEAPVYVGFGSMGGFDRTSLLRTLLQALEGERVLFYPGWAGIPDIALPDNVYVLGDTPHHWLFPRVSLAIHHGGSGTTHSACAAGIPSIVLPFAGDQFFWGKQLELLGLAGKPISRQNLSVNTVRDAVRFAATSELRSRAKALARAMAAENGTAVAVARIQSLLGH